MTRAQADFFTNFYDKLGCRTWGRTKVNGIRIRCPTTRRSGNLQIISYFVSGEFPHRQKLCETNFYKKRSILKTNK